MNYIGSFETTGELIIKDPYCGKITSEYAQISKQNLKEVRISCQKGSWYAFHFYGSYSYPIALILTEKQHYQSIKDMKHFDYQKLLEVGEIVSCYGNMLTAVDKETGEDPNFTYVTKPKDTVFRTSDVLKWLRTAKLPPSNKKCIEGLIKKLEEDGNHFIEDYLIIPLFGNERPPFESDIWSTDCYFRIKNNPTNSSPIMGGILSKTYSDTNKIMVNKPNDCSLIYIDLDSNSSKVQLIETACSYVG